MPAASLVHAVEVCGCGPGLWSATNRSRQGRRLRFQVAVSLEPLLKMLHACRLVCSIWLTSARAIRRNCVFPHLCKFRPDWQPRRIQSASRALIHETEMSVGTFGS